MHNDVCRHLHFILAQPRCTFELKIIDCDANTITFMLCVCVCVCVILVYTFHLRQQRFLFFW
jgi:hypothetical protein